MKQEHRRFEATDKVKIIREHLLEARPLSEMCEKYDIAPTQVYQWQKIFFENGAAAFEQKSDQGSLRLEQEKVQLQKKQALQRCNWPGIVGPGRRMDAGMTD